MKFKVGDSVVIMLDGAAGADVHVGEKGVIKSIVPERLCPYLVTMVRNGFKYRFDDIHIASELDYKEPAQPSPVGGTKHDSGKPDLSLLPPVALNLAAEVFMFGAQKYGRWNYLKGFPQSRLIAASLRHITAYMWGEDLDPESGKSHLGHALCCLMMLLAIKETKTDIDDRPKKA